MVKPQLKLRQSAHPVVEEASEYDSDTESDSSFEDEGVSFDSMGAQIATTALYMEPDFIVVVVGQKRDVPLICIEVKRDDAVNSSAHQLKQYIELLQQKQPHQYFAGVLILAGTFYCYSTTGRRKPTPGGNGLETAEGLAKVFQEIADNVLKEMPL
ncbi:hypothetical protein SERLA73DRAFT_69783 [Serpula lacrymans var. lacrymans S7.3]|uniref:Uncharacterized protein n=2 Tax=Serpula lacrymans var. lacrymans TaxID=341189 RepID=F8PL69_SERL3|nr:uncharacterized protein SERLADRAFT_433847 [Serpula lacrymans var. lacrymans S7.9]EGO03977.1 hypothetical protein SERLA73DRAFT_69783 [Serpula lacrymans var. lacrymans S7.3]EGO29897.1 hypothetical protein SERLADRAFT_433847 [Serpula lacrymans var. lacrymans S7.9]